MIKKLFSSGESFAWGSVLLWGLFPVITKISLEGYSPIFIGGLTSIIAGIFFFTYSLFRGTLKELLIRKAWLPMVLASVFIGIGFYGLMYQALSLTSSANAAIFELMEVFYSFLFLSYIFKKEEATRNHVVGAVFIVLGALVLLLGQMKSITLGDVLLIFATMLTPFGSLYMKKARKFVSSPTVLLVRTLVSGSFLIGMSMTLGKSDFGILSSEKILWVIVSGVVLMGISKVFYLEAIHRIPIPKVTTLHATLPLFVFLYGYILTGAVVTVWHFASFVPAFFGVLIISDVFVKKESGK